MSRKGIMEGQFPPSPPSLLQIQSSSIKTRLWLASSCIMGGEVLTGKPCSSRVDNEAHKYAAETAPLFQPCPIIDIEELPLYNHLAGKQCHGRRGAYGKADLLELLHQAARLSQDQGLLQRPTSLRMTLGTHHSASRLRHADDDVLWSCLTECRADVHLWHGQVGLLQQLRNLELG